MERNYKTLVFLFTAILLISIAGFYRSYFRFFPHFKDITFFTHIHFVIFLSWFALLIWQPILIKQQKFELHRKVGRLSYGLAPIMVLSILIMVKLTVVNNLAISKDQAIIGFTGAILDAISFSIFYILSIRNKNKVRWHVASLIGASLIILNPGLGRLINHLSGQQFGILAMVVMPYLISFGIIIYEKLKLNRPALKNPYLSIPLIWTLELVLFIGLPQTICWQKFIVKIAEM